MATEEKKPDTEATKTQPASAASASQSKVKTSLGTHICATVWNSFRLGFGWFLCCVTDIPVYKWYSSLIIEMCLSVTISYILIVSLMMCVLLHLSQHLWSQTTPWNSHWLVIQKQSLLSSSVQVGSGLPAHVSTCNKTALILISNIYCI